MGSGCELDGFIEFCFNHSSAASAEAKLAANGTLCTSQMRISAGNVRLVWLRREWVTKEYHRQYAPFGDCSANLLVTTLGPGKERCDNQPGFFA